MHAIRETKRNMRLPIFIAARKKLICSFADIYNYLCF